MKQITEKKWTHCTSAWGRATYSAAQLFEVEPSDVGQTRQNWRGQGHSSYTFQRSDVGRRISVHTDESAWTCWVFDTQAVQS